MMTQQKTLPEKRMDALADLHINPTHKLRKDESPYFLLYLNYAVNNICDITGIGQFINQEFRACQEIKQKGTAVIRKLANFFWLFQAEDPMRDFPDYEEKTLMIVEKIYALRNYFAHLEQNGSGPLVVTRDFYVFVEGCLAGKAKERIMRPGIRMDKLFKMKLFAQHDRTQQTYDFTRKGLIFLICLALYRDDAMEFTQCLEDMKLPVCPKNSISFDDCMTLCSEENASVCKPGSARAFIEFFTCYSARRGRSVNFLAEDSSDSGKIHSCLSYLSFADIIGYLNKVPPAAMDYLTLESENARLALEKSQSTESEENKEFKYKLHKRFRDRFLSFAASWCEDFDAFPCMKFKRLDISESEGRKRYVFGKENDNRVHMDRHYQIKDNAIRFAWVPEKHYGEIHIDSLRSAVTAGTMKQLLFAKLNGDKNVETMVDKYFTAYHRILETVVNTKDPNDLYLEGPLLDDFITVSGCSREDLMQDVNLLLPFFPKNLIRFFSGDESKPDTDELAETLYSRIRSDWDRAADFINRLNVKNTWLKKLKNLREKDADAKLPPPVCSPEDVKNPPRSCNISDGTMIAWVFRYFNLFLDDSQKFRQLPRGMQHRSEVKDHEYQLVHAMIGKYSMDPKALQSYIHNRRPELLPALLDLKKELKTFQSPSRKSGRNVRGYRPMMHSLSDLAKAAANCYINYCEEKLKKLEEGNLPPEGILALCKKFHVRTGLPYDRTSLLKTVLHIDLGKWSSAFDYERKRPYENRTLQEEGHIVSQIPFPADFTQRVMQQTKDERWKKLLHPETGIFDFNKAFSSLKLEILPRDFYDVKPLIEACEAVRSGKSVSGIAGLNASTPEKPLDFSRAGINRAIREIKETGNQDRILANLALKYWLEFRKTSAFECKLGTTPDFAAGFPVNEFFKAEVTIKFEKGDRKIRIMPNDINRPILAQIQRYASAIADFMEEGKTEKSQIFDFRDMLVAYRKIQADDARKRKEMIPLLRTFESSVVIPQERYDIKAEDQAEKSAAIRRMEFEFYRKKYPKLTFEEYNTLADVRNQVFHRGFRLETGAAVEILKAYSPSEKPKTENGNVYRNFFRNRYSRGKW